MCRSYGATDVLLVCLVYKYFVPTGLVECLPTPSFPADVRRLRVSADHLSFSTPYNTQITYREERSKPETGVRAAILRFSITNVPGLFGMTNAQRAKGQGQRKKGAMGRSV